MALDDSLSPSRLSKILRNTLRDNFPKYQERFGNHPVRVTSHAEVHHLGISVKRPRVHRRPIRRNVQTALKIFSPVIASGDQSYVDRHNPSALADLEARAFEWIDKDVRIPTPDSSRKSYLVPPFFGYSEQYMAIATRFFAGDMLYNLLEKADSTNFKRLFLMGLKDVARLNGLTNAPEYQFYSNLEEFENSALANANENADSLLVNLARMYYTLNPNESLGEFSTEGVIEHLKHEDKIDLRAKAKEISAMRPKISEPTRLQHRDCSGLNMIITKNPRYSNRFVDLETFGPDSAVEDIASYCIVLARGNNHVFRLTDFPHYRHVFHAYELAWRDRDPDLVKHLNGLENGQFREFLEPKMTRREYADLTAAFFANAIVKTMHLAAAGARNPGNQELGIDAIAVSDPERWHGDMNELFRAVESVGDLINNCSNPGEVRDYFYTLGQTLIDVGYKLDKDILRDINTDSGIGRNVMDQVPYFARKD